MNKDKFKIVLESIAKLVAEAEVGEGDGYEYLSETVQALREDFSALKALVAKHQEISPIFDKVLQLKGEAYLRSLVKENYDLLTSSQYHDGDPDYTALTTIPAPATVKVDMWSDLVDDRNYSQIEQDLTDAQKKQILAIDSRLEIDDDKGQITIELPNPVQEGEILINQKLLEEKANTYSVEVSEDLQDDIVDALTVYWEDYAEREERYQQSEDYINDYHHYAHEDADSKRFQDLIEDLDDDIKEIIEKLEADGVDEDDIKELLLENTLEEIDNSSYGGKFDNELGRMGLSEEEEIYVDSGTELRLTAQQAEGLPSADARDLLNLLDEEHLNLLDRRLPIRIRQESGGWDYGYGYTSPGYRAAVITLDVPAFKRAVRRYEKDSKIAKKMGAAYATVAKLFSKTEGSMRYPTVYRVLAATADSSYKKFFAAERKVCSENKAYLEELKKLDAAWSQYKKDLKKATKASEVQTGMESFHAFVKSRGWDTMVREKLFSVATELAAETGMMNLRGAESYWYHLTKNMR